MTHGSASPETTFGYLSVVESAEHGFLGGYLVVSHLGRPLEFHCTAPIRPSRAQRILYGPTLEHYLLGEQIAGALLDAARLTAAVVLTNCEPVLQARSRSHVPMAFLTQNEPPLAGELLTANQPEPPPSASTSDWPPEIEPSGGPGTFTIGSYLLQLPPGYESEEELVIQLLTELGGHVELAEPFSRIEEAIREAQRLGDRGADSHEQAA